MAELARPDPTERLRAGCVAAIERCAAKEAGQDDPDTFAELGESLFWLIALAQANGRLKGGHKVPMLAGLGWARDRIAHGVMVTAPVGWQYGSEAGRWTLGKGALGAASGHKWLSRDLVETTRTQERFQRGADEYDEHVAGRYVVPVLQAGLAEATPRGGSRSRSGPPKG